jgi:uncharacterized protein (DUF305 family)
MVAVPLLAVAAEMHNQHSQGDVAGAFTAASDKMMKDMAVTPAGDADKDFVMMMIPHHQGAIDMARVELEYGKDPMLREMAQQIIEAQEKEIATLKAWQRKNGM